MQRVSLCPDILIDYFRYLLTEVKTAQQATRGSQDILLVWLVFIFIQYIFL